MAVILCVDDEPAFLDLTRSYLSRSNGYEIDIADSAEAALDKIPSRKYDAIVSDYQMPVMDGLEFLKILREQGDNTPFIVFTGKGREEVAIEALNLGADFYLQKGADTKALFAELSNMIEQLLGRRVAEVALAESEERYRGIFENSGSAMIVTDIEGRIVVVNREFEDLSGFKKTDVEGKMWTVFVDESSMDRVRDNFETRKKNPANAPESYEVWLKRPDGSKALVIARPRFLPSMKLLTCPFIDITHLRETEHGLMRMNRMYAFLSQVNESIVRSKSAHELFPRMCKVAIDSGKFDLAWVGLVDSVSHVVVPEAWAPADNPDISKLRAPLDGDPLGPGSLISAIIEDRIVIHGPRAQIKNHAHLPELARSLGYSSLAAIPLRRKGHVIGSLNLYSKKPDHFVEDDRGLLTEIASDISYALDAYDVEDRLNQRTLDLTRRMNELTCVYAVSELNYQDDFDLMRFCTGVVDALTDALQRYESPSIRIIVRDEVFSSEGFKETPNVMSSDIVLSGMTIGRIDVYYLAEAQWAGSDSIVRDEVRLVQAIARKIGETLHREQIGRELKQERDAARNHLEAVNVMIVIINRDGTVSQVNRKGCEILGYDESELVGKNWFDNFLPPESREHVHEIFSAIISGNIAKHEHVVDKIMTKGGAIREISWHNTYMRDESGNITHTVSSGQDLSELKEIIARKSKVK